jgi:hypothetical protein
MSDTKQLECLTNHVISGPLKGIVLNRVFVHNTFAKYVLGGAGTAQSGYKQSCGLVSLESDSGQGQEIPPPPPQKKKPIQTGSDARPTSYSMGTGGSFPESKEPGCEVDHSSLFSAVVKNEWLSMSAPPVCLHDMHRNSFICYFHHLYNILLNGNGTKLIVVTLGLLPVLAT